MPGTTRYSATFDRTYEEEDRIDPTPPPNARRSRSQSWQANSGLDGGRPYTPLGGRPPSQRSSSTDNGSSKGPEHIPTRTVSKTAVKAHSNPFQFVKIGTCSLYKKAEAKEVKKPDVLKEEEEEWQTNLDSWKSRRRKMSEDVFRRAEEIRQFELEEQESQVSQKKTKTFSEMVEQRATRGRALSLCLISSPMELQNWAFEGSHKNGSCSTFSGESEENSTVNSEDEGVSLKGMLEKSENGAHNNHRTNGDAHIEKNGSDTHNSDYNKLSDLENNLQMKPKEGSYIDSGLESISSHRAGDTPDSGSDFSHDSGSSIDCDSPRTGVNLLEEFSPKSSQISPGHATTNGFSISNKKSETTAKANKSEAPSPKTQSLQYEKSIESENEMFVDDYEELQRQSDLLAASSKSETRAQGVYALNVSATPNQISKEGNSVNSLFPLSPVTELPSPEDTKTMASTLSSNITSVSDSKKEKVAKEVLKETCVESSPSSKEKLKPAIPVTESGNSKKVSSEDPKVVSPKAEMKTDLAVAPSSPTIEKSKEKVVVPTSPQTEKPKLVLRRIKTKPKKVIPPENQLSKEESTSLPPHSPADISVKNDDKDKPNNETKAVSQKEEKKEDSIKNEIKQKETPKIMENLPATAVGETGDSKSIPSNKLEKDSKDKKKIDCIIIPSTEITESKTTNTSGESPQGEKPKPSLGPKKVKIKIKKVNTSDNSSAAPSKQIKEATTNSVTNASSDLSQISLNKSTKEAKSTLTNEDKKVTVTNECKKKEPSMVNTSDNSSAALSKQSKEATVNSVRNASSDLSQISVNKSAKEAKSTLINEEKKVTVTNELKKKEPSTECKVFSTVTPAVAAKTTTEGKITTMSSAGNSTQATKNTAMKDDEKPKPMLKNMKDELTKPPSPSIINSKETKIPLPVLQEKAKPNTTVKKIFSKPKNANSQKGNTPAKQIEECKNLSVDSLNVVFQSEPKCVSSENQSNVKNSEIHSSATANIDLVPDVPPVEKVAEEMEKLILEQLEEEERAKELTSGLQFKSSLGSPEHFLTAPPKLAEPPKEKPPPPPPASEGNQKETSLKRVNSTKRIKKEIYKRRSNFLGIDNADESLACSEPSIPPPPALEEILKAEMELDRQTRLKIENESTERLTLEENEIMQKEREIIESLESEERRKQLINNSEDFSNVAPNDANDVIREEERILLLKTERKRLEAEKLMAEEQQLHLMEEKQLREREEFIRKQEADKSAVPLSDKTLSAATKAPNTSQPSLPSLSPDTQSRGSLSGALGDGNTLTSISAPDLLKKSSESNDKEKVPQKPAVPPKPLKKKEAIRKERERLRQEQEALQREREEHRRKLIQEQEELSKQKSHAPEAPVASRLGPLPPLVPTPLTTTNPHARDSASFPSRSDHGAPNGAAGSNNSAELMGPAVVKQKMPPPRKVVQNEAWGQQKMPSVRKQNQDSLTESRYNQNHWLIQEAEMRRIAELKDRQRPMQLPCSQTRLAEDDVCSNPPRVPVIPPTHNQHLNYHTAQDKMWNYASQSSVPIKKYPSPTAKESLHTIYPRETVSQQPPMKPSRVVPMERQEQMLSVSGRKRCSHCSEELGRGAAMIIESLQLYYHINCFQCCVCHAQLGNGSCGTDVRVRNQKLHCHNCYSNDEAGLKFSQV